jgi:hypothetical protein
MAGAANAALPFFALDLARQSRLRLLDMLANERLAIAGVHVDSPGFGFLARKGRGYVFEPA